MLQTFLYEGYEVIFITKEIWMKEHQQSCVDSMVSPVDSIKDIDDSKDLRKLVVRIEDI